MSASNTAYTQVVTQYAWTFRIEITDLVTESQSKLLDTIQTATSSEPTAEADANLESETETEPEAPVEHVSGTSCSIRVLSLCQAVLAVAFSSLVLAPETAEEIVISGDENTEQAAAGEEMKLIAVTRNVKHLPFKNSSEVKVCITVYAAPMPAELYRLSHSERYALGFKCHQ